MSLSESGDNRRNILDCALRLFSQKGYDATSVQEIVEVAGLSKPTLYYYFSSKQGLLAEILSIKYSRLLDALNAAASLPSDIALTFFRLTRVYFDFAASDRDFFAFRSALLLCSNSDHAYLAAKEYIGREEQIIHEFFISAARQHGNIIGKEQMCTLSFIGTVSAVIVSFLHSGDDNLLSDEQIFRMRQQFLYGIFS